MAISGGYIGRVTASKIFLSNDFAADYSGAPVANDNANTAIAKLLGMINAGEELTITSTSSAAGTTTLTVNSSSRQELTGSTTQNYKLPNATTLSVGQTFIFINHSTGVVTIQYADTSTLITGAANTYTIAICTNIGTSNGTWVTIQLPALSSGVLANSFTTAVSANTASAIVTRDASKNFITNNIVFPITSTASAAGTTTLTVTSAYVQELTGSTTQTYQMPNATTLSATGHAFLIINNSTGAIALTYNDTTSLGSVPATCFAFVRCTNISTSNGTWVVTIAPQLSSGIIPNALTSGTASATASTLALRDSHKNIALNNIALGFTTTATAAGTTTLTVDSTQMQEFTGTTTQNCVLPDATTLIVNTAFFIRNNSTGAVTLKYNDTTSLVVIAAATEVRVRCTNIGTSNGTWQVATFPILANAAGQTGTGDNVRATSPTLVTPVLGAATATSINFGNQSLSKYIEVTNLTFTDQSGAGLSITTNAGYSIKIGKLVAIMMDIRYPSTADASFAKLGTLTNLPVFNQTVTALSDTVSSLGGLQLNTDGTMWVISSILNILLNSAMSGKAIRGCFVYYAAS